MVLSSLGGLDSDDVLGFDTRRLWLCPGHDSGFGSEDCLARLLDDSNAEGEMNFEKGDLVNASGPPLRGEGWPGPDVLGVVYAVVDEGIWVQWPGGIVCLHRPFDLTNIDR